MTMAQREDVGGAALGYLTLSHEIILFLAVAMAIFTKLEYLSKYLENSFGQKTYLFTRLLIQGPEQLTFLLCPEFFFQDQ